MALEFARAADRARNPTAMDRLRRWARGECPQLRYYYAVYAVQWLLVIAFGQWLLLAPGWDSWEVRYPAFTAAAYLLSHILLPVTLIPVTHRALRRAIRRYRDASWQAINVPVVRLLGWSSGPLLAITYLVFSWGSVEHSVLTLVGDKAARAGQFTVSEDGSALAFNGEIGLGTSGRFRQALNAHPQVSTVALSSPGGVLVEGMRVGALLASRDLTAVVTSMCSSACTIAFSQAPRRLMLPEGVLGYHRPSDPGVYRDSGKFLNPTQARAFLDLNIGDFSQSMYTGMTRRGVHPRFALAAFATPPDTLWFPPHEVLDRFRVATTLAEADVGPALQEIRDREQAWWGRGRDRLLAAGTQVLGPFGW